MSLVGLHVPSPIAETKPVFDWRDPLLFLLGVGHVTRSVHLQPAECAAVKCDISMPGMSGCGDQCLRSPSDGGRLCVPLSTNTMRNKSKPVPIS